MRLSGILVALALVAVVLSGCAQKAVPAQDTAAPGVDAGQPEPQLDVDQPDLPEEQAEEVIADELAQEDEVELGSLI